MTAAADTIYAPRPGTVAHRVLGLLEDEAPREFSVAQICERLPGIELHAVKPCLAPAVDHGIVSRRQKADGPRAPFWYRFGQQPVESPAPAPASAAPPVPSAPTAVTFERRPDPPPKPTNGHGIRFALWSDGELHISRGSSDMVLTRAETTSLLHYLDRMRQETET